MPVKPFAFVLMPFDSAFDDIYKLGIQAVANECDVIAERVDEQNFSETILERIYRQIETADFVIADMTGRNPNVFYEVGYAHARGKLCTLLTQSVDDIPFDLRHHRHIEYGSSIQTLKSKLKSEMNWLKAEREKQTTSAFTIEIRNHDGELEKDNYSAHVVVEFVFNISNKTEKNLLILKLFTYIRGQIGSSLNRAKTAPHQIQKAKSQNIFILLNRLFPDCRPVHGHKLS
ncbi:nucleoside 2-deoxyribosyltransferase [Sphingobium baderi]|uniref:nucleoside 2-deoxyribosyltransferase n=1 Tax=Sphingobium baderi TaxID=1332080 RepID=UPI001F314A04|nr:nucleoside 2-deoxyribosyltransferase [Sphingobium baderi]